MQMEQINSIIQDNNSIHSQPKTNNTQLLPNQTLYVNNLNESIKLDELKVNLFHLFSQYGDIIQINARRSQRMRGQAFIVFKDITSSTNAKVSLNNTLFLGKELHISFANKPNDTLLKLIGMITMKEKTLKDLERKKNREDEYRAITFTNELNKKRHRSNSMKEFNADNDEQINNKNTKNVISSSSFTNNILFVEGISKEVNENVLRVIFRKYNGFQELRLISGRNICFVEFDNEINAGSALVGLNGYKLTHDSVLMISFAKK